MEVIIIIGLDLAKNVFQAHGAKADGSFAFRKKLTCQRQSKSEPEGSAKCCHFGGGAIAA